MTKTEARLVLSAFLAKTVKGTGDDALEKEAFLTLACGALDDLSSIASSLERLVELRRMS